MTVHKYPFSITWSDEDDEYVATCSSFPGLSALGETEEEALVEAKVALGLFIKTFEERGLPLPEPHTLSSYSGQTRLRLSKSLHRQAVEMAEREGVSLNQFIADALQVKVTGEQVGGRIVDECRREFAKQTLTIASVALGHQTGYTHTVKARDVATQTTVVMNTSGESERGN